MKIGIGLPNQIRDVRPGVLPEWARRAEEAGFSTLGSVGRIAYPGVMDTVALAAAAGATSRIGLLSTVLLGPVWPPLLVAKEAASIDGVSGGRLTLGVGLGGRPDDFVVKGLGARGTGRRLDEDIETYRKVWRGEVPDGCDNPLVPAGTREVPLLFGGGVPASFERVARSGQGYIGASLPPAMVGPAFEGVREAWLRAGRKGSPYLVAIAYFAVADPEAGTHGVHDYYTTAGPEAAELLASTVRGGAEQIKEVVRAFEGLGADELVLNPTSDDLDEVARLAEIVL
ncbi:LLM class flavin-dependent oxidoreductase [Streptomyces liangshanensis]|uniref:LLM class flavin-dependent oxidoreductase n=1 Tax=Streptomyces liangshanensis TaxID=2717324 RepID=A0A6G9GV24_9ACTN|nr:LLM class flavin-dependent oxidoreductase [Streptomyces liangshanensis]QIQ02123.1 LLM class flavin-dependent oxidoreductase [Streptomyces liangshanensis]